MKKRQPKKLWTSDIKPDDLIERFTIGDDQELDMYLAEFDVLGSIAPGKLADLTVFSRNLFNMPSETWLDIPVEMTIVNGEVVYQK